MVMNPANTAPVPANAPDIGRYEPATTLAEVTSIDGSHWSLGLHPFDYRRSHNPDLESLTSGTGSQNPFFDPAFIAASRDRMTRLPLFQLVVWESRGDEKSPRLSMPVTDSSSLIALPDHFCSLSHEFAPIGNPLFDDDEETVERFCQLLAAAFKSGFPRLKFDHLTSWSRFSSLAEKTAKSNGLATEIIPTGNRAAIFRRTGSDPDKRLSPKRKRELNRLQNRLSELGSLDFEIAADPFDILLRLEEFLLMEARGWKGRKGTSIHALKRNAAFARQSVFDMAKEGKSAIYSLRLDGRAISSLIVFKSAGCYYPWKTAFLEPYRTYSPGKLLMHRFLETVESSAEFRHLDSLAHVGSSWMSHLVPSEVETKTLVLAGDQNKATHLADQFRRRDDLKSMIKRLLRRS